MEKLKKTSKSGYFIANTTLLFIILFILIGYLKSLNDNKEYTSNLPKEKYSSYDDKNNLEDILKTDSKNLNKNISIEPSKYVKIINSCDIHFNGGCARARACPSLECPAIADLRNNMVLKTDGEITNFEGVAWYHIVFDEWVRYPDRTARDWYISSNYLKQIDSYAEKLLNESKATSTKKIIVKLKEQKLYAYDGDNEYMEAYISSGLDDLPTPIGTFTIFEKTPSRYMQGPIPGLSTQEYDLPGVPWTMYFTHDGAAIHGAYWHNNFGEQWSHGCINLKVDDAERLYNWAEAGTEVIVEK